jgi:hypothetical protein
MQLIADKKSFLNIYLCSRNYNYGQSKYHIKNNGT